MFFKKKKMKWVTQIAGVSGPGVLLIRHDILDPR